MAELWGNREALVRAWTNGYYRVCLQTDSLLAYKCLKTNEDYPMEFSNLVLACKWLLSGDGRCTLSIYGERPIVVQTY